jgi:hypothetical protein
MKKIITCKNCGMGGLVWATSKAGKYYLTNADSTQVKGENGRVIKTLQLAHKCLTAEEQEIKATYSQACDWAEELKARIKALGEAMDARRDTDEWYQIVIVQGNTDTISDALQTEWQSLVAELKALQAKYNDTFSY